MSTAIDAMIRVGTQESCEQARVWAAEDFALKCRAFKGEMQFTVVCRGEEIVFNSGLTDEQLYQALGYCAYLNGRHNSMASDLCNKWWGRMSDKQYAWAHKLANDWLQRMQQKSSVESKVDSTFETLVGMLAVVKGRSKSIKLSDNCSLHLSRCKTKIWVKDPSKSVPDGYGNVGPEFMGTIGSWGMSEKLPEEIRDTIKQFTSDLR